MAATSKLLFSFFIEDQMPLEKWQNLHVDAAALTPVFISHPPLYSSAAPANQSGSSYLMDAVSMSLVMLVVGSRSDCAVTLMKRPGMEVGKPPFPDRSCPFPVSGRNIGGVWLGQGKSGGRLPKLRLVSRSDIIATVPSPAWLLVTQTKSLIT